MTHEGAADLLIERLDALLRAARCLPHAEVERLVELASVATMRAVALELLEAEKEADEQPSPVELAVLERLAA